MRGIRLDVWEPEILKVMAELGNSIVNSILEAAEAGEGESDRWEMPDHSWCCQL